MRVRENAEGIALYHGEQREQENLIARFQAVFMNGWRVLLHQPQLAFYQTGYGQIAIIFPYLVTGPRFFAGAITLGVMTQTASAFGQVQTALSFFIDNYATLAELRAVMDRLMGLQGAIDHKPDTAIDVAPEAGRADVGAEGLTLGLPNGQALLRDATLVLPHGQSTLITGASGSGKSTLFRALAGIWPFGQGKVRVPAGARVLFLPQKPYIPIGTLRDAVKYPDEHSTASDAEIVAALEAARLGHLAGRLDEVAHWTNTLSGGEQQRLAVARALVFKPDWLFLDEATASLDEADGGGDLWRAEAAPARHDHRVDRPPAVAAPVARPPGRAAARAGRGRAAGRRGCGGAGLMLRRTPNGRSGLVWTSPPSSRMLDTRAK